MKDETKDKLRGIFDAYDKKQSEARKEQAKIKTEKKLFLENFAKKVQDVISPALDELAEAIESRGHGCEISTKQESQDAQGLTQSAQICMLIFPNSQRSQYGGTHEGSSISFIADSQGEKVWIHTAMMLRRGGSANEYLLENITKEIVESEVVHLLAECFGK
jgi:hypothetical protein